MPGRVLQTRHFYLAETRHFHFAATRQVRIGPIRSTPTLLWMAYPHDEVRAIIERALEAQPAGGVSHEDLLSIGAGVGLSGEAIERAAQEVREARLTASATATVLARRRRGVAIHAAVFFAVNAFLFGINFLTTPGEWWFLFSVFGWGLGLLLHAGFGLFSGASAWHLEREKRLQRKLAGEVPVAPRIAERRSGVRVEGPLHQIEDPVEPTSDSAPRAVDRTK
jgi:2TM domain